LKILIIFLFIISSCVPTVEKASTDDSFSSAGFVALMDLHFEQAVVSNLQGSWNINLSNAPGWLSAEQVGHQIILKGLPLEAQGNYQNIRLDLTQNDQTMTTLINVEVRGDILRPFQWHLRNDGESFFSLNAGVAGQDMKVIEAWQLGAMGEGIKIAVSDSGLEINHPDLMANMLTGMHRNYVTGNPAQNYVANPLTYGQFHGTAVSGIISSVGWNNIGGVGVAPKSKLAGFQFIESAQTAQIMISQASGDFDIFNFSYGTYSNEDFADDLVYLAHIKNAVQAGRGGRGQLFVKSAGNEYFEFCSATQCAPQNANIPMDNNSPFIVVVGATEASGFAASYSNAGSNIWVSAPGGEFGDEDPAIITTDLSSCSAGVSSNMGSLIYNRFEKFSATDIIFKTYNPKCDYTSTMNGTSSAAPNVAGVMALVLSEFPDLTWREVKDILARTAYRIHPTAANTNHYIGSLNLAGHVYEQGWVQNAAGVYFHNWYGFGQVDAKKAVERAREMRLGTVARLGAWSESNPDLDPVVDGTLPAVIPDGTHTGISRSVNLNFVDMNIVESVQVKVKVTHELSGQVGVELTSPSGTKSILLNINNALLMPYENIYAPDEDLDVTLTSHAFYGENVNGIWTIKLIDGQADTVQGSFDRWSINVLGH
jgi:subtilisin family serine protease/subtilisin-like proprotein convertase family protein